MVGESEVLRKRLRARPEWREWDEPRIDEMLAFNEWLQANAATTAPPVQLFDTTHVPVDVAVDVAEDWVLRHLSTDGGSR
jgi:hypothetical protein